jgi:hypothetical protein
MIQALVYLVVVLIVLGLLTWLIDYLPVPQPLNRFAKIAIVIIGALIIIAVLLSVAGVNTGFPVR